MTEFLKFAYLVNLLNRSGFSHEPNSNVAAQLLVEDIDCRRHDNEGRLPEGAHK